VNSFISIPRVSPSRQRLMQLGRKNYIDKPMNIIMCLEEVCNLHCIQCDIWKTRVSKLKLTVEQRKSIIDKLKDWTGNYTLIFFAGEPLLHPQILDLISYASRCGVKTMITTNGTMLHKSMRENLIQSGLTTMIVSIDSLKAEIHDKIRGYPGTYARVIRGLFPMFKMRQKYGKPRILLESLIMNNNYKELPSLVRWAHEIGADGIGFQPVTSKYGFGHTEYRSNWHKTPESLLPQYNEVRPVIQELIEMKKQGYKILNSIRHLQDTLVYFRDPDIYTKRAPCQAHNNFAIADDGGVFLCFSQEKIGDGLRENYQQLWISPAANRVRKQNKKCDKTSKILLCNSCDLARDIELCSQSKITS